MGRTGQVGQSIPVVTTVNLLGNGFTRKRPSVQFSSKLDPGLLLEMLIPPQHSVEIKLGFNS
jgi:hypothetical protein